MTVRWLHALGHGLGWLLDAAALVSSLLVVGLITAGATLFFAMLAWRMLSWGFARPQSTPGIGIPLWIPQSAIMVAALGCVGYALRDVVAVLRKLVPTRELG